jgi:hypothetical protein
LVCTAEDRTYDLPLILEGVDNASTAVVPVLRQLLFRDGFESGGVGLWSDAVP